VSIGVNVPVIPARSPRASVTPEGWRVPSREGLTRRPELRIVNSSVQLWFT
jgi:hypothetical protein